jgi:hypothetical protein
MNTPRHSFPPNMAVDDGVYPFPIATGAMPSAPALMLRTASLFGVAARWVSIRIAGRGK